MTRPKISALLLNLDPDLERLHHMETEAQKAGIEFKRLPGILGDAVPDNLRSYFFEADGSPKTSMKRGEIGCYASHLRALREIALGSHGPYVLVMEDDLHMTPDSASKLAALLELLPENWDIVRLSCPPRRAFVPLASIDPDHSIVAYSKIPNSAGAYLTTPQGAQKFLEKGVRGLTFDDDLRRPWFHHMNTYGVVAPLMKAGILKSTIDTIEPGRFDKGMSSRQERLMRGDHFYALRRLSYNIRFLGFDRWLLCMGINGLDMILKPFLKKSIIYKAAHLLWPRPSHDT